MKVTLVQGDITRQKVDALVNAANEGLRGGGGVDGAIHRAGGPEIMRECDEIRRRQGGCPTGTAVVTGAGNLPADWVIHTVGPIWRGGHQGEPELLAAAYRSSLEAAREKGVRTVAFPSISTGVYGYPIQKAAPLAIKTVKEHLEHFDEVRFVLFSDADFEIYQEALEKEGAP